MCWRDLRPGMRSTGDRAVGKKKDVNRILDSDSLSALVGTFRTQSGGTERECTEEAMSDICVTFCVHGHDAA